MKYILKIETNICWKLTIAAAVAKPLAITTRDRKDAGKTMLVKTYNEFSAPEIITHLLDFPD